MITSKLIVSLLLISTIAAQSIPVSDKNPFNASSHLPKSKVADYKPANLCDTKLETAWVEGVAGLGINEWAAIYLGKMETLKDISELTVSLYPGYQKDFPSFENNSYPTELKIELFLDNKLVSSKVHKYKPMENSVKLISQNPAAKTGAVWLKITIIKAKKGKKWEDTAISEVICDFTKSNPNDIKGAIKKFNDGINKQKKDVIREFTSIKPEKIIAEFKSEFDDDSIPGSSAVPVIHSDNTAYLYAVEGGDGASYAKFNFINGKWQLTGFFYLSNMWF